MTIQENLKRIRNSKGITQKAVANYLEISEMAYSRLENEVKKVDANLLYKASEFLGVDMIIFFSNELTDNVIGKVNHKEVDNQ